MIRKTVKWISYIYYYALNLIIFEFIFVYTICHERSYFYGCTPCGAYRFLSMHNGNCIFFFFAMAKIKLGFEKHSLKSIYKTYLSNCFDNCEIVTVKVGFWKKKYYRHFFTNHKTYRDLLWCIKKAHCSAMLSQNLNNICWEISQKGKKNSQVKLFHSNYEIFMI